ncbi:MAG: ankyrin repeat domain-containing protein [Kiritimatiellae bacterium]|nr:ankyrin repeat domain-containing protein [Kiritimatiellia bacterium]
MKSNDTTADDKFWTELSRAGEVGDRKRFNELLDSVGKVQISMVNEYDDDFWTPLMHAVEDGDMKRFEELIADGADVNIGNLEAETYPITLAAEYGHDEMFFRLIELGARMDVNQYCCPCCDMWYGFNPADLFVYAMEAGSVRIARYLYFMGVRPWSETRSLWACDRTVIEAAAVSGKMGFIKAIFAESELARQKPSVRT